jgi:hypothetical protein
MSIDFQNDASTTQGQSAAPDKPGQQQRGGKQEGGTASSIDELILKPVNKFFQKLQDEAEEMFNFNQKNRKAQPPAQPPQQANQELPSRLPRQSTATRLREFMKSFEKEAVEFALVSREGQEFFRTASMEGKKVLLYHESALPDDLRQRYVEAKAQVDALKNGMLDILKVPEYLRPEAEMRIDYLQNEKRLRIRFFDGRRSAEGQEIAPEKRPLIAWATYDTVKGQLDSMKTYHVPRSR